MLKFNSVLVPHVSYSTDLRCDFVLREFFSTATTNRTQISSYDYSKKIEDIFCEESMRKCANLIIKCHELLCP